MELKLHFQGLKKTNNTVNRNKFYYLQLIPWTWTNITHTTHNNLHNIYVTNVNIM